MARPKLGETDTERLQLKITSAEIAAIDDWRFANRIPSRSEAVRRLVQVALRIDGEIDRIHQRTREINETLQTHSEVAYDIIDPGKTDWKRLATVCLASTSEILRGLSDLSVSVNSTTEQVHRIRSNGEFVDLSKQADEIAVRAKERAKMFKLYLKSIEDDDVDHEEDDQ